MRFEQAQREYATRRESLIAAELRVPDRVTQKQDGSILTLQQVECQGCEDEGQHDQWTGITETCASRLMMSMDTVTSSVLIIVQQTYAAR